MSDIRLNLPFSNHFSMPADNSTLVTILSENNLNYSKHYVGNEYASVYLSEHHYLRMTYQPRNLYVNRGHCRKKVTI